MNKTESDYALHLSMLKSIGEIDDYAYEPETLKLGPDCRYTPDFRVIRTHLVSCTNGGTQEHEETYIEFHEVKGTVRSKKIFLQYSTDFAPTTKPFIEDDALVKIKTASSLHPYKFIIVWKGTGGVWEKREIN